MTDKNIERIESIFKKVEPALRSHHKESEIEHFQSLLKAAKVDNVSALVCGEFKRGKSSFINAFLGEDVCPTDQGIATAVVSIIKYGEKRKVTRFYGETSELHSEEVVFEEIEKYAKGSSIEIDNTVLLTIELPSEKLKSGLILMDSPGVGGIDSRHLFVTLYVLPKADVTFFIADAGEPLTVTELDFFKDKILSYSKRPTIILNKCDLKSKDEIEELIADTKSKIAGHCGLEEDEVEVIPVSSMHWQMYNRTKSEKLRISSNCESVRETLDSVVPQFKLGILQEAKDTLIGALDSTLEMERYQLSQLTNPDESQQEKFKERLTELQEMKNNINNPQSPIRKQIFKAIKDSQQNVISELTKQSVLFSTQVLESLLKRREAQGSNGGSWVLRQINMGLETLAGDVDLRIQAGFNEVSNILGREIKVGDGGFSERINIDLSTSKTVADKACTFIRSALPGGAIAYLGASILGVFAAPVVAAIGGLAGAAAYVWKTNKDTSVAYRVNELKSQLGPQITIVMNDLKMYVQSRYDELGDLLVEQIKDMTDELVSDMQGVVKELKEIEDDRKAIAKRKDEIESSIKFIETHKKQTQLLLTNPFAK